MSQHLQLDDSNSEIFIKQIVCIVHKNLNFPQVIQNVIILIILF